MIRRQFMSFGIVSVISLFFDYKSNNKKNFGGFIERYQSDFVPALIRPNESVMYRHQVIRYLHNLKRLNNKDKKI